MRTRSGPECQNYDNFNFFNFNFNFLTLKQNMEIKAEKLRGLTAK